MFFLPPLTWLGVLSVTGIQLSFTKSFTFCQPRMVAVKESWSAMNDPEGYLCIYAPNNLNDRVTFFSNVISFILNWECCDYLIYRDFNSVLHSSAR